MASSTAATTKGSGRGSTRIEFSEFTYEWDIENFKLLLKKNGEGIRSPIFRTINTELEWELILYPEGYSQEQAGFVSIFVLACNIFEQSKIVQTQAYVELSIPRFLETHTLVQSGSYANFYAYTKIIKRSALLDLCGSNDTFTIRCKIQVPCEIITKTIDTSQSMNQLSDPKAGQMNQDFRLLFKDCKMSDVVVIVGTETFPAHKVVLAARSPVFSAMFEHKDTQENLKNEVKIEDMEPTVVEAMLEFFYTDEVKNLDELAYGLLEAAGKYDISGLKMMCENALYKGLTNENAVGILVHAELHDSHKLKEGVMDFIKDHVSEVIQSESYQNIEDPALLKQLMASITGVRK